MATVPATLDDSDSVCDSISDSIISDEGMYCYTVYYLLYWY